MKKLAFIIVFCISLSCMHCFGQNKVTVREIFYQVDENGTIHENKELGERTLVYTKNRGVTKIKYGGGFRHNLESRNVENYDMSHLLSKTNKSNTVYDNEKRLVECTEHSETNTLIKHFIRYNQYDDPVEIKSEIERGNGAPVHYSTVTFEYFYFCDYPMLKFKNKELNNYYKAGFIPSKKGCPWMLRTIKKDGATVQHVERKLNNSRL